MPLPGFLAKLFSGGANNLIDKGFALIDNLTLSKEEKEKYKAEFVKLSNEHIEKLAALTEQEFEAQLKDIADARASNVQIQNSQGGWLAKNVAYCLDIFIILIWGGMTLYVVGKFLNIIKSQQGVDFSGVLGLYAGVTALATQK